MVKMIVIDVDLGQDIKDIINDDVEEMTEQTRAAVDEAIAQKHTIETERMAQAQLRIRKEQEIEHVLGNIYEHLLEAMAADSCVTLEQISEMAAPTITNTSALILQIKTYIRKKKNNAYVLHRHKKNKKPVYILLPFNTK